MPAMLPNQELTVLSSVEAANNRRIGTSWAGHDDVVGTGELAIANAVRVRNLEHVVVQPIKVLIFKFLLN